MPVMDALREVHSAGMLHRDVSPDNIYITAADQVKLLDFGAARYAIGERSQLLSVILKPGYAPEEQYSSTGRQGHWTDVYSLAATMYRAIVGGPPPDSIGRLTQDGLKAPSQLGISIPPDAELALLKALAVRAGNRYQSVEELQKALAGHFQNQAGQGFLPPGAHTVPSLSAAKASVIRWRVAAGWGSSSGRLRKDLDVANRALAAATDSKTAAQSRVTELQGRVSQLEDRDAKMTLKVPGRQPGIVNVRFRNELNSVPHGDYGEIFSKSDIYYIHIFVTVRNNWPGIRPLNGQLTIKVMNWDLTTVSHTFTEKVNISSGLDEKDQTFEESWGNTQSGSLYSGLHDVQFWWGDEKIGQASFYVQ